MKSSQRLKPLKTLADNKEKTAAQNLGKSVQNKHQQLEKLAQLVKYRSEYVESMSLRTQQGMTGEKLQQYHQFLSKLDTAIEHQKTLVVQSEQNVSQSQKNWQSDNGRASAINKVMTNIETQETRAKDKQESKQTDELSTQAFLRSKRL